MTREELKNAARELNDFLALDPPVDLDQSERDLERAIILEQAPLFRLSDDGLIEESTMEVLRNLAKKYAVDIEKNLTSKEIEVLKGLNIIQDEKVSTEKSRPTEDYSKKTKKEKEEKPDFLKPSASPKQPKQEEKIQVSTPADRIAFLTPLIAKGMYTKKELIRMAAEKFSDVKESTLNTMLSNGRNPKYNKFKELIVRNEKGILSFQKE